MPVFEIREPSGHFLPEPKSCTGTVIMRQRIAGAAGHQSARWKRTGLLRELKATDPVRPVILLTANDTDMDIVAGLEQGADDYITKPFSLSVLRARVNMHLRKNIARGNGKPYLIDRFVFDFERMQFLADGVTIELSKTEYKLLRLLVENQGRVMGRGSLIDRIWTDGADYVDENALSVTVKRLRDKLRAQDYIQTVYGIGYIWVNKHE